MKVRMIFPAMMAVAMISGTAQAAEQLTAEQLDTVTAGKYMQVSSVHGQSYASAQAHGNHVSGSAYTGGGVSTSTSSSSSH